MGGHAKDIKTKRRGQRSGADPPRPALDVPRVRRGRRGVLDQFDADIIELLAADGRASTKHIAEQVGLTDATVAARVRNLLDRDIVRVRAAVDWNVAGFRSPIVFFVRANGRSVRGIGEQLMGDVRVHSVSEVFGAADLIVRVLLADPDESMAFADEALGAIEGADIVMSLLDVDVAKHDNGLHTGGKVARHLPEFPNATSLLDPTDARLLECLVEDARQSLRQIGRILDVSEHTVRSRLRRLEEIGLIRICAQVDQDVVDGSGISAYVALRAHHTQVPTIIDDLVGRRAFRSVDRTVGEYNVLALAHADSRSELADLVDGLRAAPGVERSETWLVASHQLCPFPWARI